MKYPIFLKKGDSITVFAPSAGIDTESAEGFDLSLKRIKENGWSISETDSVRTGLLESTDGATRAKEFKEAFTNKTNAVVCAAGGEFCAAMLDYTDLSVIKKHPKWIQGYSDPTNLLFPITTLYDTATIYGFNAGGYDSEIIGKGEEYSFDILKGNIPIQQSFGKYQRGDEELDVKWRTPNGIPFDEEGRIIGGCMDVLVNLIGTKYDGMDKFVKRYAKKGILWYFDIYSMTAESVYLALWHMKEAGWFEGAKGFIFGRICIESSYVGLSYDETIIKALGNVPIIFDADIGHVKPRMTVINGAWAHVTSKDGKGTLELLCK